MGRCPEDSGPMSKNSSSSGAPSLKAWSHWRLWKPAPFHWNG
nr:MAG TPA: hypothetical protein [Caudoviricetes sp.]